jgi:hypothetical protein
MDRTAGKERGYHAIPYCPIRRQSGGSLIAMFCTACIVLFASEASAQCTARDVLQNRLTLKTIPSANTPPVLVKSAFAVPVWRTITVGTFANSFALLNALDAAGCGIGNAAELANIYARAQQLGFGLAAAEVAPQLRLQYLDQPRAALVEPIVPPAPATFSITSVCPRSREMNSA